MEKYFSFDFEFLTKTSFSTILHPLYNYLDLFQSLGSSAPIVPTKILTDTEELDRRLMQVGYTQGPVLDGYSDRFHAQDQDLDLMVSIYRQVSLYGR